MRTPFATISLTLALVGASATAATHPAAATTKKVVWTADTGATYRVMQEDGPRSPNRTDITGNVFGGDTSSMFTYQGKTYTLYQDNFGPAVEGPPIVPLGQNFFSVGHLDWRSQTMAVSSDTNPADGITFDSMITDNPGHAKELIPSPHDRNVESTLAPSYGTAIGNRMYMHYISVKTEGLNFLHWQCNYSGTAYSDDGGQTWVKGSPMWTGDSDFSQVAIVQQGSFTYLYGVPCVNPHRGAVHLARVPNASLLDVSAYRYWTGKTWSPNIASAQTIVPCCVYQFSVRYNSYYKKWIMMYQGFRMRTSDTLTGPWSQDQNVFNLRDYPAKDRFGYAAMITPSWNDGPDIWFTVSDIFTYSVSLWHTALTPDGAQPAPRMLSAIAPYPPVAGTVKLTWKAPAKSNAAAVTGYVVTAYYATDPAYEERFSLPPVTFKSTKTTETITGLKTGTAYTFKIAAINKTGIGPQSVASNAVTAT